MRSRWFRNKTEALEIFLLALVCLTLATIVLALTVPDDFRIAGMFAFGVALLVSASLNHLATQSGWRSRSLVMWVVIVQVAVILSVPLLALAIFPDWRNAASIGSFQSIPYAISQGFMIGLFLLIFSSTAGLVMRWWSAWRDR